MCRAGRAAARTLPRRMGSRNANHIILITASCMALVQGESWSRSRGIIYIRAIDKCSSDTQFHARVTHGECSRMYARADLNDLSSSPCNRRECHGEDERQRLPERRTRRDLLQRPCAGEDRFLGCCCARREYRSSFSYMIPVNFAMVSPLQG